MKWQSLLPRPCYQRPFVCDGFPELQDVIVIGENPATETQTDWWTYWSDQTGFDRKRFMDDYRRIKPVRGTRARLERMRTIYGLRVLETNVASNERLEGAGRDAIDNTRLLACLLEERPVIVQGEKARDRLSELGLLPSHAILTQHFSRMGYDELDQLCERVTHE
ncbi:MAG: hypothetical protein AB3N23_16870 [Paracoccaceae bacterium]